MLKFSGRLEVFQNEKGYVTGVLKAWNEEEKKVLGKTYMDVRLPESVQVEKGQSLTLQVKTGYINAIYVSGDKPFTKLQLAVAECEVVRVFPESKKEAKKASKKVSK